MDGEAKRRVNGVAKYPVGGLKTMQQIMAPVAFCSGWIYSCDFDTNNVC